MARKSSQGYRRGVLSCPDRHAVSRSTRAFRTMELGLPAVLALGEGRRLRADGRRIEPAGGATRGGAENRFYHRARPSPGRKEVFAVLRVALSPRSTLGPTSKSFRSRPRSPAATSRTTRCYDRVMDADAPEPKVLLADKGYASDAVRADIEDKFGVPVIPMRKNRKMPHRRRQLHLRPAQPHRALHQQAQERPPPRHSIRQDRLELSRIHTHRRNTTFSRVLCRQA